MPSPTQESSSASVRVFSLDRAKTIDSIRDAMNAVTERCPEIDRVILFGSLARGEAVPDSDTDVLVLPRDTTWPFQERLARYVPAGVAMGVGVFPCAHSGLQGMSASGNPRIGRARRDGIDLL